MKIKKILVKRGCDSFYRLGDYAICEEFVQEEFNITDYQILVEVNSVRPHQKGWQKLIFIDYSCRFSFPISFVKTKNGIKYELLSRQCNLLKDNGITEFWIKITPTN